jgi:hypothetical protein
MPRKKALTGQARQQLYIAKLKSDPAAYEEYKERERETDGIEGKNRENLNLIVISVKEEKNGENRRNVVDRKK